MFPGSAIGDFVNWTLGHMEAGREAGRDGLAEGAVRFGSIGEQEATRLVKAFTEIPPSKIACSQGDLAVLLQFLRRLTTLLRDQVFLFQPFMARHMELGIALVGLTRSLHDDADDIQSRLVGKWPMGECGVSSDFDEEFASNYCTLGQKATRVIELIWSSAREMQSLDAGNA